MTKIYFYAQLKDYFGDVVELDLAAGSIAEDVRSQLSLQNALAKEWLKVSRLASEDAFIAEGEVLHSKEYYLLPPSSGG
ncbi:MAG: hypothetical protein LDLANPLL_02236 [Turneriella sp.]|nr:hypothetical protein [Turneriella sp.]